MQTDEQRTLETVGNELAQAETNHARLLTEKANFPNTFAEAAQAADAGAMKSARLRYDEINDEIQIARICAVRLKIEHGEFRMRETKQSAAGMGDEVERLGKVAREAKEAYERAAGRMSGTNDDTRVIAVEVGEYRRELERLMQECANPAAIVRTRLAA